MVEAQLADNFLGNGLKDSALAHVLNLDTIATNLPTSQLKTQIEDYSSFKKLMIQETNTFGILTSLSDSLYSIVANYADTIVHSYPTYGPYEVTMIAHGCHEENDTLKFLVTPKLHADPSSVTNGNGYFSLFPNPSIAGNQIYVYLNALNVTEGNVSIQLYSITGQLVQTIPLLATEGTYPINESLSTGVYLAVLIQGEKMIEQQKLIVH